MATSERYFYGTGRRKTSVARVRVYPGSGEILVNGKGYLDVFTRGAHQAAVLAPLKAVGGAERWNVQARIAGGGISGWAGALSHGIARALARSDEGLKPALRRQKLLTRDARMKERKKVGLKRARKAPQYTKR
ncbi:MAG TPA: 30S ribosomal protein S9 [Dehalococcoidia bacterium]|nr:30S ribosomal protein S9 [Dehalococcoidia bacterium]